jgi:hypothetical protein
MLKIKAVNSALPMEMIGSRPSVLRMVETTSAPPVVKVKNESKKNDVVACNDDDLDFTVEYL